MVARIKAIFRRTDSSESGSDEVVKAGDIIVDFARREVAKSGNILELSYKEFEILKLLILNRGKVLSRDMILEKVWGFDYYGETRTVDVHQAFASKIEDDDNQPFILKLYGNWVQIYRQKRVSD